MLCLGFFFVVVVCLFVLCLFFVLFCFVLFFVCLFFYIVVVVDVRVFFFFLSLGLEIAQHHFTRSSMFACELP